MAEGLPRYDFFAERLCNRNHHQLFNTHFWQVSGGDARL